MRPKYHIWLLLGCIFLVGATIGGFAGWAEGKRKESASLNAALTACVNSEHDLEWEKAQLYAGLVRTEDEDEIATDRDVELIANLRSEIARLKAQRAWIAPFMKSGALIVQERH